VEKILHKLSSSFSSITNNLVGIDSSVEELITSYLGLENNVCMIGICGMGGLGKTTLARVVYDKFRSHFEGSSFIVFFFSFSFFFFFSLIRQYFFIILITLLITSACSFHHLTISIVLN
jgi:hypothetical protein